MLFVRMVLLLRMYDMWSVVYHAVGARTQREYVTLQQCVCSSL